MTLIQAFILDLDGVLTDTSAYHFQAWKHLADDEQIPFTRADNEHLRGVSRRQSLMFLLGTHRSDYTEAEIQELMTRKNSYYQALLAELTTDNFLPGASELLQALKQRGLKIAVGSASKNTHTVLRRLHILELFDAIGDGYSVERAKPAPDLFLHVAAELGVAPEACAVVEDARSGVEAALASNMLAIGVGPEERVGAAHYRYASTAAINLDEILGSTK